MSTKNLGQANQDQQFNMREREREREREANNIMQKQVRP